ncbi:hypothetical protein [Mycobacterium sp. ACS4331]|uniref:hypothetical protein n=1 Tax=Mycobacterium sp. ACS4331 TaxID=1834121 RepID=UPI000A6B1EB4|nr:hypothetical protein [Mycobacterium sp. ACS4331]
MRVAVMVSLPILAVGISVVAAPVPEAAADCVTSGGTTLCSQGDARGTDTGQGPGSGPVVPYPCDLDWYCDDYGWSFGVVLDPGDNGPGAGARPPRPNNDLPGRGGGGGRGGGRR